LIHDHIFYFLFSLTSGKKMTKTPNTIKAKPMINNNVIKLFSMIITLIVRFPLGSQG